MSRENVVALLSFLDDLFQLGGKLVEAAQQKHPELRADPLPDLTELDQTREEAIKRVGMKEGS